MLSIARSRLALPSQFVFLAVNALALLFGLVYNKQTPEFYKNNAHGKTGWIITWIASAWISMALVQVHTGRTKASSMEDQPGDQLNMGNMARYQRVQDTHLPETYRWSNDSGQGTERNSTSLYSHSRSPSVKSEEQQQFIGQSPPYNREDEDEFDGDAEKRGFLNGTAVDRFFSRNVARFAVGKPLKVLRFLYVFIERTILVQGFVAITSGTVVYGGIGVRIPDYILCERRLTIVNSMEAQFLTCLHITSKAESFSGTAYSLWDDGWVRSRISVGGGT
jgi:hypothetical protein